MRFECITVRFCPSEMVRTILEPNAPAKRKVVREMPQCNGTGTHLLPQRAASGQKVGAFPQRKPKVSPKQEGIDSTHPMGHQDEGLVSIQGRRREP